MRAHQLEFEFHDGDLLEEICEIHNLRKAFKAVKRKKGSPGIDGTTIEEYEETLSQELNQLREEVLSWIYKPTPVKRVKIPKPRGKGVRLLGIPIIKDRVLHMAIKQVLEPLIDPTLSEHSYGFRPGKNQRNAVEAAREIVRKGKEYVVDIDLSQFFDRIHHDRLIHRLKQHVKDKRVLRLIGMILRSGIMTQEGLTIPKEGSVQGSPLSPLLSNVVLDELDKELEKRSLEFCRYADDCNIFVRTAKAAKRVSNSIKKYIEKRLKLKVNEEKSQEAKAGRVKFLGMTIADGLIAISKASYNKAMEKVKMLIPRGTHIPIERAIERFNNWYRGWGAYYSMTQFPAQLKGIEAHARRRYRAQIVRNKKRRRHLYQSLIKRGVTKRKAAQTAYSRRGPWAMSHTRAVERAYSNRWFTEELGMVILSDREMTGWTSVRRWVKLT